jgi:hypothetical protein
MLLKFFLYTWRGVGEYLLEQRSIQEVRGLPMRKTFFNEFCGL